MNQAEIREMKTILSGYLEKVRGLEKIISETPASVELWKRDPMMQASNLYMAVGALSNSQFYAARALEQLQDLTCRIKRHRKERRHVACSIR